MKLLLIGAAFSAVAFTSCSDDDNNGGINNQVQIAGTYRLTEVNTEEATDFNEDNTSNVNQMMESNCFIDSQVTFNADNTFIYNIKNILVDEAAGTSACNSYTVGGIWILQGGVGT
ncbi:MAG TPA: hypothetical protein VFQ50_08825, partial [Flavobacterium sp.]|nr:hypothetical protein [Flavobacterium sp.]